MSDPRNTTVVVTWDPEVLANSANSSNFLSGVAADSRRQLLFGKPDQAMATVSGAALFLQNASTGPDPVVGPAVASQARQTLLETVKNAAGDALSLGAAQAIEVVATATALVVAGSTQLNPSSQARCETVALSCVRQRSRLCAASLNGRRSGTCLRRLAAPLPLLAPTPVCAADASVRVRPTPTQETAASILTNLAGAGSALSVPAAATIAQGLSSVASAATLNDPGGISGPPSAPVQQSVSAAVDTLGASLQTLFQVPGEDGVALVSDQIRLLTQLDSTGADSRLFSQGLVVPGSATAGVGFDALPQGVFAAAGAGASDGGVQTLVAELGFNPWSGASGATGAPAAAAAAAQMGQRRLMAGALSPAATRPGPPSPPPSAAPPAPAAPSFSDDGLTVGASLTRLRFSSRSGADIAVAGLYANPITFSVPRPDDIPDGNAGSCSFYDVKTGAFSTRGCYALPNPAPPAHTLCWLFGASRPASCSSDSALPPSPAPPPPFNASSNATAARNNNAASASPLGAPKAASSGGGAGQPAFDAVIGPLVGATMRVNRSFPTQNQWSISSQLYNASVCGVVLLDCGAEARAGREGVVYFSPKDALTVPHIRCNDTVSVLTVFTGALFCSSCLGVVLFWSSATTLRIYASSPVNSLTAGVWGCSAHYAGPQCPLWNPNNEFRCSWDAGRQLFVGAGCVYRNTLQCACEHATDFAVRAALSPPHSSQHVFSSRRETRHLPFVVDTRGVD